MDKAHVFGQTIPRRELQIGSRCGLQPEGVNYPAFVHTQNKEKEQKWSVSEKVTFSDLLHQKYITLMHTI